MSIWLIHVSAAVRKDLSIVCYENSMHFPLSSLVSGCAISKIIFTIGVEMLPYLYRVLHQLASRWNSLSLQLSVSGQDEIQRNARSADICLAVSLVEWLQSGQATWKALVEAVFRPAGGGHQVLARDIARNYRSK